MTKALCKLLSRVALAIALTVGVLASPALAQNTRANTNTASGNLFQVCSACITPQLVNAYTVNLNNSIGFLIDTNAWTGANSFSVSPTVPTATLGDSSLKAASTAFVINQIAALTTLPAGLIIPNFTSLSSIAEPSLPYTFGGVPTLNTMLLNVPGTNASEAESALTIAMTSSAGNSNVLNNYKAALSIINSGVGNTASLWGIVVSSGISSFTGSNPVGNVTLELDSIAGQNASGLASPNTFNLWLSGSTPSASFINQGFACFCFAGANPLAINGLVFDDYGTKLVSNADIYDLTHSLYAYEDLGVHTNGITLGGTYSNFQISGAGWFVDSLGDIHGAVLAAGSVTITPTAATLNQGLAITQAPAGSASADVFLNPLTLNIGALSDPGHNIYGFGPACNVASSSFSGQLFCGYTSLNVSVVGTPGFPNDQYVGHFNLAIGSANTTDVDASIFAGNDNVQVTGTGWHYIVGREIDVTALHAIADTKNGLRIAQSSVDAFQGTLDDAAIELINQGGAVGWKKGIEIGASVISSGGYEIWTPNAAINANGFAEFGTNSLLPSSGVPLLVHAATNVNFTISNNSNVTDVSSINDALGVAEPMQIDASSLALDPLTITLPNVTTGTPTASLCINSSNQIIKKTTAGSCV